jgi:regulator of sigma D
VNGSRPNVGGHIEGNAYDPDLIDGLQSDHRELLVMFSQISRAAEQGPYDGIPDQLTNFKTRLEAHLLAENYRFYGYLEEKLSRDSENATLIRDFRKEMNTIARQVVNFIKTWRQQGVTAETAPKFREELGQIGTILKHRIGREEQSLYPLYSPMD